MNPSLLWTLLVYQVCLLGIGLWASRRTQNNSDFYLGGRGLGPWVAALSSAASSSSAWTLLGVSGAAYTQGLSALWLFPACLGGFLFNWLLVARPLRRAAKQTAAVTLTEYLAAGSPPRQARALVVSASWIILLSLLVYVASQFQAAGKTFAETLDIEFHTAVWVGGAVVLAYTMSGGFWAASVTDMLQGLVMVVASVAMPVAALFAVGGLSGLWQGMQQVGGSFADPWAAKHGWTLLAFLVGTLGIGLGYPGQPHVVNRFMALRSDQDVRTGTWISLAWGTVIYGGMLLTGWCGRVLFAHLEDGETVLMRFAGELFSPIWGGIFLAAILSAIMSTADSQLLVCGSTVAYDLPRQRPRREVLWNRLTILGLGVAAIFAAIQLPPSIFDTVLFAWSGLGSAFGPLLLVRLRGHFVHPTWALAALWSGFFTTLLWAHFQPLGGILYELIPAFSVSLLCSLCGVCRQKPVH